jgi:hypothetical protein
MKKRLMTTILNQVLCNLSGKEEAGLREINIKIRLIPGTFIIEQFTQTNITVDDLGNINGEYLHIHDVEKFRETGAKSTVGESFKPRFFK